MAQIGNYPELIAPNCPYLDSLKLKLISAKNFAPHKVAYYEELIKQWLNHTAKK